MNTFNMATMKVEETQTNAEEPLRHFTSCQKIQPTIFYPKLKYQFQVKLAINNKNSKYVFPRINRSFPLLVLSCSTDAFYEQMKMHSKQSTGNALKRKKQNRKAPFTPAALWRKGSLHSLELGGFRAEMKTVKTSHKGRMHSRFILQYP